jgi:hypothetical protein
MADSTDFGDYPKGQVAFGAGDLVDAADISFNFEDGEKVLATLRQNPAGSTHGARSCTSTFKSLISAEGFERDYMTSYRKRKVVNIRLKVPGLVFTCTGRLTKPQIVANVDNAIEFTVSVIGRAGADPV